MPDHSFLPLRDLDAPRPPEDFEGDPEEWDPSARRSRWLRRAEPGTEGGYVLYWMQMQQRHRSNPAVEEREPEAAPPEREALPDWARQTLEEHRDDPRDPVYDRAELEAARTHDEVWNAAQRELVATGTMQGYVRMLWGKQIIRWTESYEEALDVMLDFHRRYALDGRDPNTYANVLWCFGLHDRAWQETPILGKTRPMSSDRTRQKFDLEPYFERVERRVEERAPAVLRGDA